MVRVLGAIVVCVGGGRLGAGDAGGGGVASAGTGIVAGTGAGAGCQVSRGVAGALSDRAGVWEREREHMELMWRRVCGQVRVCGVVE